MLSILIPTKGRPEKLEACIKSIDIPCEILVLATSESDVTLLSAEDDRVHTFFDFDKVISVIEAQNYMAQHARGDLLPISDDITFDPGSIQRAIDCLYDPEWNMDGDGVVAFHVRNMECADYAYMLVGRKFYQGALKGELFHSGYKHFFADQETGDRAKKLKRFIHCMDATIMNFHPSAGFPEDETHRYLRGEKLAHDQDLYDRRVLYGQIPS